MHPRSVVLLWQGIFMGAMGFWASAAHAAIEEQHAPPAAEPPRPAPQLTRAPVLRTFYNADYPADLLSQQVSGFARLGIEIDGTGAVERVTLSEASHPAFGEAALSAATHFDFVPAEIDGLPAPIAVEYRYNFAPQVPEPTAKPLADPPVLFSGIVREAGTRAPVANAAIAVGDTVLGGTDSTGAFALREVPAGALRVSITHPDYEAYAVEEQRSAAEKIEAKYYLVRIRKSPYETVVRSKVDRREVSKIELTREELQKVPGTFGDPIRVLENLPGMGRAPLLGGQLLVRGANPADTQVLVDGMPVPLLYHFLGLTSVINAEFLERIDFFPGGFGARYGRATAGVVDIVTRDLNCDLWHSTAKADVIDAAAFTCVPIGSWRIAAAGRRSYIDALLPLVIDRIPRGPDEGVLSVSPVYYDYQVRARTSLPSHVLDVTAFGSNDDLKVIQSGSLASINLNVGLVQGFHRLVLRDRYRINEHITLTSTVSPAYQWRDVEEDSSDTGSTANLHQGVFGVDWREDFVWELLPNLRLAAGIDHTFGFADLSFKFPVVTDLQSFPTPTFDYTNTQSFTNRPGEVLQAYWVEGSWDIVPGLRVVPGLRLENFHFDATNAFVTLPRITVRWEFIPGSTVKAAYGVYARLPDPQYLLQSYGNPRLHPERAQHFVAGWEQTLPELINLDLQGYYNLRYDLTTTSRNTVFQSGKAVPELYANTGTGETYGLELMLRRAPSAETSFYGWVAYTLSRSLRRDHALGSTYYNGAQTMAYSAFSTQEYLSNYDQTHILTVVAQWVLPRGFEVGFRFRLVSGNPVTDDRAGKITYDADADSYSDNLNHVQHNASRLPTFHQLDVRVDKTWTFDLWKFTAYLELLNAYYAKNVEQYQYDYRYRGRVAVTLLPIIPNLGVKGEF